ncbi:ChrB protein [Candidatus Sulfopaludibacter sp. SbA3]|nr:ChrB protein [Candidatus Sulfopaludibacter sp. SbA3]
MTCVLLLHQIPPSPTYFRAKILRKLNQLGACPIKNSAYLLPETQEQVEDFQWVRTEIEHEGGEAWLFRVEALGGVTDEGLKEAFRRLRSPDYQHLLDSGAELLQSARESEGDAGNSLYPALKKLKRRFEEIRRIDFFDAPERRELEDIMKTIETTLGETVRANPAKPELTNLSGKTWVTRRGVKVDRIATAWLIRRFADPAARFQFIDPAGQTAAPAGIRFDMFEGEFTHEGDLCTFEVLLRHLRLADPALAAIAQMVHDIDLKTDKHELPETSGFAAMIEGITALHSEDEARIAEGSRVLNAMHAALGAAAKG